MQIGYQGSGMARYEEAVRAVDRYGLKLFQEISQLQAVGVGVLGDLPLSQAADDQFCIVGMVDMFWQRLIRLPWALRSFSPARWI